MNRFLLFISYFIISHYNKKSDYRVVNLYNESNIININGEINKNMLNLFINSKYMNEINGFDNKWKPIINIIINSNGGDYFATIKFISKMEEIKKKNVTFHCYSIQACSSAFVIFQYCDHRFILSSSLLFHHNATIKIPLDTLEYFYENYYEFVIIQHKKINKYIASKVGLTYKEYMKKIRNDWVINGGKNIIANQLADEIVIFQYKINNKY
jgi:hypothetical protein